MKNQYVGDINDYKKYGLIRTLAGDGAISVGVFWMMTANDNRSDGLHLKYLDKPEQWRKFNPEIFDSLHSIVHKDRRRHVSLVEEMNILPGASYISDLVPDDSSARKAMVSTAIKSLAGRDLVFFDPDNGLEIKSKKVGNKGSNKYLFFDEVEIAFAQGHSLLIYQHFPRINRKKYIADRTGKLKEVTGASMTVAFSTTAVCFFLIPQPDRIAFFKGKTALLAANWGDHFQIYT